MSISKRFLVSLGILLWCLTLIFAMLPFWPHLYYRLTPKTSQELASVIADTASQAQQEVKVTPAPIPTSPLPQPTPSPILPEVDPSLPEENGLIINKIGVRGQIHEGTNWEDILKLGVWRVPDFGTPDQNTQPIILAAHRWGYLNWSIAFRRLNSFYHLPKLIPGDTIQIIWHQRQYEYKVYSVSTGTEITDYNAKLILYTCQLWNSPIRFFVYANPAN